MTTLDHSFSQINFPPDFKIIPFLFVELKASLLAWSWSIRWVNRVGYWTIYSFKSIIFISDREKNPVSVGIYDEELWWQRDRWERCLWLWGFSLTTMKRMEGKKCVLVWHNKSNALGREGWNESGLTESLLCARGEYLSCSLAPNKTLPHFYSQDGRKGVKWRKLSDKLEEANIRVVWYDWIADMKKRGKLFHFIEMGKNNHEILKDNEVFNVFNT